jgi:hypothetical protein
MKKLLLALVLATNVFAQEATVEKYTETTGFALYYYQTQPDCEAAEGKWDEQGLCFFEEENKLNLTLENGKVSSVEVMTWGGNGHSCSFESKNIYDVGSALKVVEAVEAYDFESGEMKPTLCEVTLKKTEKGYSVDNNGKCNYFCGARAWLYIEEATKK